MNFALNRIGLAPVSVYCLAAALCITAGAAKALTINPIFDSSITSMSNASQVEGAFDAVAADFESALSSPVTVNVEVSWGSVAGQALPSNAVGASVTSLYGYYTYSQIRSDLAGAAIRNPTDTALQQAVANLPATAPSGTTHYVVASAEAKALGLISATSKTVDGAIGFAGASSGYSYKPAAGIASGTYDFQAVAAHELEEVLGRSSGIYTAAAPTYRTVFDLYRYSAPGVLADSYTTLSYFSINGGRTSLGYFNDSTQGGDRGDWLTPGVTNSAADGAHAVANDVQDAFIYTGASDNLTVADLTALDALGYNGANVGNSASNSPAQVAFNLISTPEPGSLPTMLAGLAGIAAATRRVIAGRRSS